MMGWVLGHMYCVLHLCFGGTFGCFFIADRIIICSIVIACNSQAFVLYQLQLGREATSDKNMCSWQPEICEECDSYWTQTSSRRCSIHTPMSFTFTSTPEKTASRTTTASIYLSPSKRRRISPPPTHVQTRHSTKEIWSWTFKSDAVATCSVKDALDMKENELERMHLIPKLSHVEPTTMAPQCRFWFLLVGIGAMQDC